MNTLTKEEKQLFRNLCDPLSEKLEVGMLDAASPAVLGHLFWNRMQAAAYAILKEKGLVVVIPREFRSAIAGAYEQNREKNSSFFRCINELTDMLSTSGCRYAMLKGAYLCRYYPEGMRTSNDIDLLVMPKDVTKIGKALADAGFSQGYIRNGSFVYASRKEIIESKMLRGETVPYIKEVGLPSMRYLEVDINFSLDYKNSDGRTLEDMLERATETEIEGMRIRTLAKDDFFIHLCAHLYKEATTLPWVEMKRDMTLYKYCDIHMLLANMTKNETEKMLDRAKELEMEKICAFAIIQTAALFDAKNAEAVSEAQKILEDAPDFIHTVISPKEKKSYVYSERDIAERFYSDNRAGLLIETEKEGGEKQYAKA